MSRDRRRARACTGKVRHPDRAAALAHVTRLTQSGAAEGAYRPYPCPAGCGGWHVGHRTRRSRKDPTTR